MATAPIFSAGEGHRGDEAILPVDRIGGGDRLRAYEVDVVRIPGCARGPVYRARKHDLTVDDHSLGVGYPDASIYPYRHPGTS